MPAQNTPFLTFFNASPIKNSPSTALKHGSSHCEMHKKMQVLEPREGESEGERKAKLVPLTF